MDNENLGHPNQEATDSVDASRLKVLSPGMMVYKRFIRNRLAIIGLGILLFMFLFSFLGGFLWPYGQDEVFRKMDYVPLDYASATYSTELRYTMADGCTFSDMARTQFSYAIANNQTAFSADNTDFIIRQEQDDFYLIGGYKPLMEADVLRNQIHFKEPHDGFEPTDGLMQAFQTAYDANEDSFDYQGKTYGVMRRVRWAAIAEYIEYAIASKTVLDAYSQEDATAVNSYGFRLALKRAMRSGRSSFAFDGVDYIVEKMNDDNGTVFNADGEPFAEISNIIVNPVNSGVIIPVAFKKDVRSAIVNGNDSFYTDAVSGEDAVHYTVWRINANFNIKTDMVTEVLSRYESPSTTHPMGTDDNAMDLMARLMYGGRISLTVGFVVVFFELLIGVVVGGISGYFSGWVDTALMRFVDLFNTIPSFPMMIILAGMLDAYKVEPSIRIYLLMLILGLLGWTSIARVVRGQIFSLREQDFMVAAEASGLRVSRRIFRHLMPNVMPLLIVNATMGLGNIIITEATLSFLGLGVKYPLASWGAIVNSATNVYVMSNYPYTWMPAGFLIFFTVLGFNFVGDGLRDAFDPKMKR